MKNLSLRNIISSALLIVVGGAFSACLTFNAVNMTGMTHTEHSSHTASDAAAAHIVHAQEFSLSTMLSSFSFDVISLLSFVAIAFSFVLLFNTTFVEEMLLLFRSRKRRVESKYRDNLITYISRFVRSPEFI